MCREEEKGFVRNNCYIIVKILFIQTFKTIFPIRNREKRGGMNWEIEIDIYTLLCIK